ncbi:MAG: AAA family ATPase [Ignavibacteriaceae bacterium]|nr:AAA family ATPase [Ignavibacteriaceae bacterium]
MAKCSKCGTSNRDIAKFCKSCGEKITSSIGDVFTDLIGLNAIKDEIVKLVTISKTIKSRQAAAGADIKINMHTVITGTSGTGKSTLANILQQLFFQNGIISKATAQYVDAVDYQEFTKDFQTNLQKAKGGILFIDNVQKLVPGGFSSEINLLDKLFSEMDKFGFDPIVILAGLPQGFEDFLAKNPSIKNRFQYYFRLPDYSSPELFQICQKKLKSYNLSLNDESSDKLHRLFKFAIKTKTDSFGNAHYAITAAENIFKCYLSRITGGGADDNIVHPDDIEGKIPEEKSLETILAELDDFVGMDNVKNAVKEIAQQVQAAQQRVLRGLGSDEKIGVHLVLTGNPGTGKTSIARKLGEIFAAINYLDSGHVVEVDRSALVGQYLGETPKLVSAACDKAVGGILFIDEAYTLAPASDGGSTDQYGKEAVETLMKRMEDDRGKFVVIAAGYQNEMERFINVNPGMKSRFNRYLNIQDYTPDELYLIFKNFFRTRKYNIHAEAEETAKKAIKAIYDSRDKNFANGREMRSLFEQTISRFSSRITALPVDEQTDEALTTIIADDLPVKEKQEVKIEDVLKELNELIGMKNIKQEVNELISYLEVEKKRAEAGGKETSLSLHFVFTGNPGTGKTTVARILANVFKSLGLLSRGQLIEVDSSKLVAGYIGQTAIKTNNLIDSAMGGVLFIDEAYTLSSGGDNSFGKEAIDTLLKRVEDDRGKFIAIIAGYTNEMREFLSTNPGLQSRFTRTIHFGDYSAPDMVSIFKMMAGKKKLTLAADMDEFLPKFFDAVHKGRDKNFGNAREVRNIFEKSLQKQSTRLAGMMKLGEVAPDQFNILTKEDIPQDEKKVYTIEEIFRELNSLIGLKEIKEEISQLIDFLKVEARRAEMGGKTTQLNLHFVFTGNPGTGKTTVARILGNVFRALGLLPKGHVVEVERSQLVASYVGQTSKLTNKVVDSAMGGLLFIDEAYTLYSESGSDFGKEAIDTILKRMEDDRGKFIIIAAGYTEQMETFLNMNPGLSSRFTKRINFADYLPEEMLMIFGKMIRDKEMSIDGKAEELLLRHFSDLYNNRDQNFGNARTVRNLFEKTLQNQSRRVAKMLDAAGNDTSEMNNIIAEDLSL